MEDDEIQALIQQTEALLAENEALMAKQAEVFAEVKLAMAEQLGCSQWDLDRMLERDLSAEERDGAEQAARDMMRQFAPEMDEFAVQASSPASGSMPVPGAPRPRRRMV